MKPKTKTKAKTKPPTSTSIVRFLIEQGHTQQDLAKILGVARSFISHVANGRRNLTVTHLEALAVGYGMTLPELYLKAVPLKSVPAKLREGYGLYLKAMETVNEAKMAFRKSKRKAG